MIKIITALGNPNLNNELKKYSEFEIIGNDIQYKDGIIEILEFNTNIDYLIISEILDGQMSLENLIDIIYKINKKIKIILILNEKDTKLEEILLRKGIYDILYDKTDYIDIVNLLKTKNIEITNKELRNEIEKLKKIIMEKNNKKLFFFNNKKNNEIFENKIIGISGSRGIGKTTFSIMLANILKNNYKVLLVDFDFVNSNIKNIYKNKYLIKNKKNIFIEKYMININKNLNVITNLDSLYISEKNKINDIIREINKLKNKYNYIILDLYYENNFKENKVILDICDQIILLTGINNLEIEKSKKILNNISNDLLIDNKKINIIIYKYKIIDYIFFNEFYLKNIFKNIKIIGKIKYCHIINILINKEFKNINFLFYYRKKCLSIINKIDKNILV